MTTAVVETDGIAVRGLGKRYGKSVALADCTFDLPAGDYGVAVIDDINGNKKLDRNFLGIPTEGFGFANNPKVTLSAPPYSAAVVHVTCPVTETTVHLIYK